jgi:hypothetical protein
MGREPSRKAVYLRNTLKQLSMMGALAQHLPPKEEEEEEGDSGSGSDSERDIENKDSGGKDGSKEAVGDGDATGSRTAPVPVPESESALSLSLPVPAESSAASRPHSSRPISSASPSGPHGRLLRMDSSHVAAPCQVCAGSCVKGISCSAGHFLCTACFNSRVRDMCALPEVLKEQDFAITCPIDKCAAEPWSSYHVRKLVDGPSLEMYINTLILACRQAELVDLAARGLPPPPPPPLAASSADPITAPVPAPSSSSAKAGSPAATVAATESLAPGSHASTAIRSSSSSRESKRASSSSPRPPLGSPSPSVSGSISTSGIASASEKQQQQQLRPYLEETLVMLRDQLRALNVTPMEYIPLPDIQKELQSIFDKLNNEQPYDEARMDFLLMCMEHNPVYMQEKAETARLWREEMTAYTQECLATMRGFVPPHIFESSLASLKEEGVANDLAKRLLAKKCLWLTRMRVVDIERIHEVDLMGRFNPIAQGLDIVELAAVFACVPERFLNDPTGHKAQWRLNLENALREMDKQKKTGGLVGAKARHPCYKQQKTVPYQNRNSLKLVEAVKTGLDE